MGDRIAIMRRAAGRAVRDPGRGADGAGDRVRRGLRRRADRALKRLALMRVADIDLWEAPLAYVGQPTAEVRAKLAQPDVEVRPTRCWSTASAAPLGWLSERDLRAETVPARP